MAVHWTQLPQELLQSISEKITLYRDYVRFRAVCPQWRRSILSVPRHLSPQLPWLMLPFSSSQPRYQRSFYDLSTDKTHYLELPEASRPEVRIGSSNGWLVILDDSPAIVLLNPLTRAKFHLPPLISLPTIVSFNYSKVGREYEIKQDPPDSVSDYESGYECVGETYEQSLGDMRDTFIKKIVISSDQLCNDFIALAVLVDNGFLAYYKQGDLSWTILYKVGILVSDVTYYKRKFYAVSTDGELAVCNINRNSSSVSVIIGRPIQDYGCQMAYLVNSGDDELLMVIRYFNPDAARPPKYQTLRFDVFTMNWSGLRWDRVENLGDRVLFIGGNSSMSLSGNDVRGCLQNPRYMSPNDDYKQCLENCIYFTDDICHCFCEDCNGIEFSCHDESDRGIFKLWDETISSLPCRTRDPHALWITPSP